MWLGAALPLALILAGPPAAALTPLPQGDADHDESARALFLDGELSFVEVTMDPAALDSMLENPWSNELRLCSLRWTNSVLDETIGSVAIRPRGNTSRFAIKKSWKLSFNTFVPGRKFHGLEKVNLNGEHNDVSIIRSKLAWDLYKEMLVPSSRAHHVQLKINDGALVEGVQIHVEQVDEEFVQAWFDNKDGYLYKCLFQGERADLRYVWPGTGDTYKWLGGGETYVEQIHDDADYEDLAAFIDFVNNTDDAAFAAGIVDRFSVDGFLRSMAVDAAIGNWDNYWFGANNYYLYNNPDTGRFEYIPYDLDNSYGVDFSSIDWATRPLDGWGDGGFGSAGGELPPLIERVLAIPAYEAQLRRYVLALCDGPFALDAVEADIDLIHATIGPYAYEGSYDDGHMDWGYTTEMFHESFTYPDYYRNWGWGWDYGLEPYITDRRAYLLANVPAPPSLPALRLNEVLALNVATNFDEVGDFDDWLELHNAEPLPLDAGGMYLSDDPGRPKRWEIPAGTAIASGGKLLVWCDGEVGEGPLHAGFRLDVDGEQVALFADDDAGNVLLGYLSFPELAADVAYGRYPDGDGAPVYLGVPTPGAPNQAPGNLPPFIDEAWHEPLAPSASDPVTVTARIRDLVGTIASAELLYNAGDGFTTLAMFDDGTHGDGPAGDEIYGAVIPPQADGATVGYYISALDDSSATAVDPPGAPGVLHHFEVGYAAPPLYVNEFLASNTLTNQDEWGDFDDWVEIYNAGHVGLDLGGMQLSDDLEDPDRFVFPDTVIPPRGFLVVWCDGEPGEGPLHADFRLGSGGEGLGLFDSAAHGTAPIDTLSFGPQSADVSYGRDPDGGAPWRFFPEPTPGGSNSPDVAPGEGPAAFRALGAFPNPARAETRIEFQLPEARRVSLRVYGIDGREIARPPGAVLPAGRHGWSWDGRDRAGRPVASGLYLYRLRAGSEGAEGKILILR